MSKLDRAIERYANGNTAVSDNLNKHIEWLRRDKFKVTTSINSDILFKIELPRCKILLAPKVKIDIGRWVINICQIEVACRMCKYVTILPKRKTHHSIPHVGSNCGSVCWGTLFDDVSKHLWGGRLYSLTYLTMDFIYRGWSVVDYEYCEVSKQLTNVDRDGDYRFYDNYDDDYFEED